MRAEDGLRMQEDVRWINLIEERVSDNKIIIMNFQFTPQQTATFNLLQ